MGMAASQARLLCLTARMHDIEYQAQCLQATKIDLSTLSDNAYKKYNEALDATTLTAVILNGSTKETITANFNNLFSENAANLANSEDYALFNERGQLIVSENVYKNYQKFSNTDAQTFAIGMLTGKTSESEIESLQTNLQEAEEAAYKNNPSDKLKEAHDNIVNYLKDLGYISIEEIADDITSGEGNLEHDINGDGKIDVTDITAATEKNASKSMTDVQEAKYKQLVNEYKNVLYQQKGDEIYQKIDSSKDFDYDKFSKYVSIFNQIQANGGNCVSISSYNAQILEGDSSNNSEWLQSMLETGKFSMATVTTKDGQTVFNTTSPTSDSVVSYTSTTSVDQTAAKKAEAEYENTLSNINKKDKQIDLELSKLESERSALDKEYESVKKVIDDNVERTFGIFS